MSSRRFTYASRFFDHDFVLEAWTDRPACESMRAAYGELPRFENSRNVEIRLYFAKPRRRRNSLAETAPSFLTRAREASIILRNRRSVLNARVSSSAFRIEITAANGFPALY